MKLITSLVFIHFLPPLIKDLGSAAVFAGLLDLAMCFTELRYCFPPLDHRKVLPMEYQEKQNREASKLGQLPSSRIITRRP